MGKDAPIETMATEDKNYKTFSDHQPNSEEDEMPFETSPDHVVIHENQDDAETVSVMFVKMFINLVENKVVTIFLESQLLRFTYSTFHQ